MPSPLAAIGAITRHQTTQKPPFVPCRACTLLCAQRKEQVSVRLRLEAKAAALRSDRSHAPTHLAGPRQPAAAALVAAGERHIHARAASLSVRLTSPLTDNTVAVGAPSFGPPVGGSFQLARPRFPMGHPQAQYFSTRIYDIDLCPETEQREKNMFDPKVFMFTVAFMQRLRKNTGRGRDESVLHKFTLLHAMLKARIPMPSRT
ncbi:hypothetical protein DFH06DRAFT_1148334 [Mycena polygramma]|nr:hypothetical protein DFH06DRAFT_1148334 [Mycena polygramma]